MEHVKKPEWLKINLGSNELSAQTHQLIENYGLHTICSSGRCPNQTECWGRGTATFMIGGDICTRCCKFCNTKSGKPNPLDIKEPLHVAESIREMNLKHAVITSVDRDDLADLGAAHWVKTIQEIKRIKPIVTMEVLIPDFQGRMELLDLIIDAQPDVISHNMETVERLTSDVRSVADYRTSLKVLEHISKRGAKAKTGIMVGLGETMEEVEQLMNDVLQVGCRILTIGQYLQPTRKHYPVAAYITPEQFASYGEMAKKKGFIHIESAPLVRSSYHAERVVK